MAYVEPDALKLIPKKQFGQHFLVQDSAIRAITQAALACRAPQLLAKTADLFRLSDDDFVDAIRRLGGIPDTVALEPALMQLALPTLRADFEMLGTHAWQGRREPMPCPLFVYGGSEDQLANRAEVAQWRGHTSSQFQIRLFSGGHFFINSARGQLLKTLAADLSMVRTQLQ